MAEFERNQPLVTERDDLSAELAGLYQQTGRYEDSLAILQMRHFQPWEGGEGLAIGQHVRTNVAMGRQALITGCFKSARRYFEAALSSPDNLGEAKHVLVNYSHVYYWLGVANHCAGDESAARKWWEQAAVETGDFQEMSVRTFSEMSYYRALALDRLSRGSEADRLAHDLLHYAEHLGKSEPKIDYFATSLPAMLLFREDLRRKSELTAAFLSAQALNFLGNSSRARDRLQSILAIDPNHALAADFLVEMEQDKLLRARMPQPQ